MVTQTSPVGPSNVRVVDAVLTNLALGYSNTDCVGSLLFPAVPVSLRSSKIIEFGIEAFRLYNTKRQAGSKIIEVSYGYDAGNYNLEQDAVSGKIPLELADEAMKSSGIALGNCAVSMTQEIMTQVLEYDQSILATTISNYDAAHKMVKTAANSWFDHGVDPITDLLLAKEAVRRSCGRYPNSLVLSPMAWLAIQENPNSYKRLPTQNGFMTLELLSQLTAIDLIKVGTRNFWDDGQQKFCDIWGEHAVMAWVNTQAQNPLQSPDIFQRAMPSYGYTYTLTNGAVMDAPYFDQSTRSYMYPAQAERKPLLTGMNAGFLLHGVGSQA